MTIYSLYIFDRHTDCVYFQDWHRTRPLRAPAPANDRPGVHRLASTSAGLSNGAGAGTVRESIFNSSAGFGTGPGAGSGPAGVGGSGTPTAAGPAGSIGASAGINSATSATAPTSAMSSGTAQAPAQRGAAGLPFDEEAKLVYGVVLSLRNMVKKLSGRDDEQFTSYKTPQYSLHLYETLTGYKFVLLSDPQADNLKFVLKQLHTGPFVEFVVRNPLIEMDSRERGIDSDQFRSAVDRQMRALSFFA